MKAESDFDRACWELSALPERHYRVILADPPWAFRTRTVFGQGRSPGRHYDTMNIDQICALPVGRLAAKNSLLFIWTTWAHLPEALRVITAWGFEYKSLGFDWTKLRRNSGLLFVDPRKDLHMSMGYWARLGSEPCLRATRGKVGRSISKSVRSTIIAPVREHSRKPDEQYERIEAMTAGPYLELFARQERPGWTAFGNQKDRFASPPLTEGKRVIHDRNMQQVRT